MKRLLGLSLAILLIISLLTGCGGNKESERNVLRVGMECEFAPYNWAQATDANGAVPIHGSSDYAFGYDVIVAKALAEFIDYDLEIHRMDWDALPPAVMSGAIDAVIAGMSITAERQMTLDFTAPYYYASIVTLVRADSPYAGAKGISDLSGAVGTSQLSTIWYNVCLPQIPDINIMPPMDSAPAMLVALTSGAVDLVVTDAPTAMAAVLVYPELKLLDFYGTVDDFVVTSEEVEIGIALQKGNSELLDKLNAALATLTIADFERMMNDAIKVQPLEVSE